MLELRPNCELCDKDLPPASPEACICSYECTFCKTCVETILKNVCPKCGGGFVARPIRPPTDHRPGVSLNHHPATTSRVHTKYRLDEITAFANTIKDCNPEQR